MDTATRVNAAQTAIRSGLSPNEVRFRYHDEGPVEGGDVPFMQQQDWPLSLITEKARQDLAKASAPQPQPEQLALDDAEKQVMDLARKDLGLVAA